MEIWRKSVLFYLGGCSYMGLELLWRGRTHGSMFLAGGASFVLLGQLPKLPLPLRAALGAGAITLVELAVGLAANRDHAVWDYRGMPGNLWGQICPLYSLLWALLAPVGWTLYENLEERLPGAPKPFPRGEGGA